MVTAAERRQRGRTRGSGADRSPLLMRENLLCQLRHWNLLSQPGRRNLTDRLRKGSLATQVRRLTSVVSASPPPSVVAHPGENFTFQCTDVTVAPGHVGWFKQDNGSEPLCIAYMYSSEPAVQHHNGFQPSHMEMLISHRIIFLKITEVDVADSGVYFCGMFDEYIIFTNATVLKVQGHKDSEKDLREHCEEVADLQMTILVLFSIIRTGVLLCCLTIFIIIYTTRK
ncbi:uncharacterized protein LOC115199239 [Salmo trutta]|uniref:uncharacterized protein LOC115199239 n=1 Tax=Salmo trutta TaxID=8032 RepID=UPI001131C629|nr:uncharacterized protein LOC115199239 [Salmo trutta]